MGDQEKDDRRSLRRSRQSKIIGGVSGGLGDYFDVNPWWFRILFLIALIPGGVPGIFLYLILWIIIPSA